jgi:hypothetical protein
MVMMVQPELAGWANSERHDELAGGPPRAPRTGGDESMDSSGREADNGGTSDSYSDKGASNGASADPGLSFGRRLRRVRMACRLSQIQLAQRMRDTAVDHGGTATLACLKVMISKWENEVKVPNEYNRRLLAAAMGVTVADLGLPEDPDYIW